MENNNNNITIGQKMANILKSGVNKISKTFANEYDKAMEKNQVIKNNDGSQSIASKILEWGIQKPLNATLQSKKNNWNKVNNWLKKYDISPILDAGLMFVPPQYSIPLQLGNRLYNHYAGTKNYYKGRYYEPNYGKYHFVYNYWKNRAIWNKTRYQGLVSYWKRKYFGSKIKKKRRQRWGYNEWLKTDPMNRPNAWDMYNYDWTPMEKKRFEKMWEFNFFY